MAKMMLLPAAPGSCHFCATVHGPDGPHNYWSLFYQMRFQIAYGRAPTHADAVAHLSVDRRERYRQVLEELRQTWNEPEGELVREPYAESTGENPRTKEV
jgi:hypothetical protein